MHHTRRPTVAGQFYKAHKDQLLDELHTCFTDERGPGSVPEKQTHKDSIKGLVVPHAGYSFSGPIAAHAYHTLASNQLADTYIILGPNHTGQGSGVSIMTQGSWKTPLGDVPINSALAETLATPIIDADENAHQYEHSIEVQLPFLQYIQAEKSFDFIPICMMMQDYDTVQDVVNILTRTLKNTDKTVVLIASSDFTHAGFNYQSMPPAGMSVDEYTRNQDKLALEAITNMDPQGLIHTVEKNHITMCGYGPVATTLAVSKNYGATTAELLKYGTSNDIYPTSSCVGYGAFAIY